MHVTGTPTPRTTPSTIFKLRGSLCLEAGLGLRGLRALGVGVEVESGTLGAVVEFESGELGPVGVIVGFVTPGARVGSTIARYLQRP